MARKFKKNTIKSFGLLSIFVVVIVVTFGIFIYKYLSFDKTKYEVAVGSILYDDEMNFIQVAGDAYITQKMDKNYYLYEEKEGETYKYNLGKNSVVYRENDSNIYLYGKGFQVLSSGDVNVVEGETKIVKSSPTKFFKLADRKYLIVDSAITSVDNNVVKTSGYLIIDLDKQGNPWFSNNVLSFKTIAQLVIKGTNLGFDIANEVLTYNENKIDLKNILGSSNQYDKNKVVALSGNTDPNLIDGSEAVQKIEDEKKNSGGGGDASDVNNYYDEYLNAVIKSINNLTNSVSGVNENTNVSLSRTAAKYYDFSKWVALKTVKSDATSITIGYSVFDPSNEYQSVALLMDEDTPNEKKFVLDKDATEYTIRGLSPSTSYHISLIYQKVGVGIDVIDNTVVVKTKDVKYGVNVSKITKMTYKNDGDARDHFKYKIDYELSIDPSFKFVSALVSFQGYRSIGDADDFGSALSTVSKQLTYSNISASNTYKDSFILGEDVELYSVNVVRLSQLTFCALSDELNCSQTTSSNIEFSYKFFHE